MSRIRLAVGAAILAAAITVSVQAQTPAPAAAPAPSATQPAADSPSTMDKVTTWSRKKWKATRAELSKDKGKYDGCVAAAHGQKLKLSSRVGWAFVYDCMKKS
jgi:hypothetical protein